METAVSVALGSSMAVALNASGDVRVSAPKLVADIVSLNAGFDATVSFYLNRNHF